MSTIQREEILHVAKLARLELCDDEVERMAGELTGILDYVEQLNEVDVEGVEPTSHSLPLKNVLRDDVVCPSMSPAEILAPAPEQEADCYKVPAVLRGGGDA